MTITETHPGRLLRFALTADGVATGASGVALTALAGVLDGPLGIGFGWLLGTGLFFLGWGAFVLHLGTRPTINRRGATFVVAVNLLAALDSVLVALVGDLTALGTVVVLVLAVAVAAIAVLQIEGLRQS
ncbi:MAG: hypothetical protein GEV28_36990 [Actinophytocola sp.]|uniref:hypothetical protein n=1 Tax=Actinophytocola sp. TaxID=1872138 RepID=UPI0013248499|nr:hypothetical protein [Actinophytocola sp.]MPZ85681.1 hypothetical protein [Actinophytocola sp.]